MTIILLETMMKGLRKKLEALPATGDIELTAEVELFLSELPEDQAWDAAAQLFGHDHPNAEKFVEMIDMLAAECSCVSFDKDYADSFTGRAYAHQQWFESETRYGALAKCVLYAQFFREAARIERIAKHPKSGARVF